MFFVVLRTACFSVQGQRGGCTGKKRGGVPAPHSLNSFVFCGLSLLIGFPRADTEKSGETIATPPKRGVPTGPDSGTVVPCRYPAPGGRYRRYLSLREGFSLALDDSRSVLAVKGSLRRFAPLTAPGRCEGMTVYEGKGGVWISASDFISRHEKWQLETRPYFSMENADLGGAGAAGRRNGETGGLMTPPRWLDGFGRQRGKIAVSGRRHSHRDLFAAHPEPAQKCF